jgi:4-amino-4-deoxy-L-arabinose transferase-like glycosyltransferase
MDTPTPPKTTSFSHQAAKLSWVCPIITIIIFVLLIFNRQIGSRKIIALVASAALWLVVIGLVFGIVALFGISKHGTKGILAPAIVGIIINGLLLSFVVVNFMTARARAMQPHGGIDALPVRAVWSNKSLQATRDGRSSFPTASGFTSFGPACLSSER